MKIRRALEGDLDRVVDILNRAVPLMNKMGNFQWDSLYPNREIYQEDINLGHLFVVTIEEVVIAAVSLNGELAEEYSDLTWSTSSNALSIHRMVVDPDRRGLGVAKRLFSFAEEHALKEGYNSIWLDTNENNSAMVAIFKILEYRYTGIVHFRGKSSNFLCFEKAIEEL